MTRHPGFWRAVADGVRVHVAVVLVAAGLQTLFVALAGTPGWDAGFVVLAVASLLVSAAAAGVVAAQAVASVGGERMRLRAAPFGWSVLAIAVAAASAVLFIPLSAVVLVGGAWVVAASTTGRRSAPIGRTVLWALEALAGVALVALVQLVLGFFVAGTAAAFLGNLVAGFAGVLVLVAAARLLERDDVRSPASRRTATPPTGRPLTTD